MNAIEAIGLKKSYGDVLALKGISFEVGKGEILGLIGPDGAGKTSIFRILTTLILPDEGRATVDGLDVVEDYKELRTRVGYMPGRFSLYPDLSVKENLDFFAGIFGVTLEENYDLVAPIYRQIEPFKTRRAGKLSGGMKQKLAFLVATMHAPEIVFLDEPTGGVDPITRRQFWSMIREAAADGTTIFVTTHYMDEAAYCDRVSIMVDGKIRALDTPDALIRQFAARDMNEVFVKLCR